MKSFNSWVIKYGKSYRNAEETLYRFNRFRANYLIVKEHNKKYE